uniref:NADH-ubiquinone oxidoreductase chain 2 n=1 Tax=Trioza remota TaxID=1715813 RepID=A0A344A2V3_9HEMI|nr:NADH dehydrogenase subunit 2 [Trioza remota]AWU49094.1 NADH dehydrogenase subunit 2 [Trioza remota]
MHLMNLMIIPLYVLTVVFPLSSNSWMMIWMGMEMNLLMFIFLIMETPISMIKSESAIKYFLIQSISSVIFITSINSSMIFYNEKLILSTMLPPVALMIKSSMAPLHSWSPPIVSKFNLIPLFLFMTMQKLVPMFTIFSSWLWITPFIVMMNISVGSIGGLTQSSLIKMLIFSSINNSGWMLLTMMNSFLLFWVFFLNYVMISILMMKFMWFKQVKWMIQIKSSKPMTKWFFFSIMMSLSGFPPFLGFAPKWLTIKYLFLNNSTSILMSIFMSILTLFFYLKSSLNLITNIKSYKKWFLNNHLVINMMFILNITGPMMFYLIN